VAFFCGFLVDWLEVRLYSFRRLLCLFEDAVKFVDFSRLETHYGRFEVFFSLFAGCIGRLKALKNLYKLISVALVVCSGFNK
jgi:hypothetical protein